MVKFAWIVYGKLLTEQLSIMTLSSNLKNKNISCLLIYSASQKEILEKIGLLQPDIIGYSLMYGSHWIYYGLANEIKQKYPQVLQVAGGPFTTFYPQSINEFPVDAISIGEADISLPNLIKRFADKKTLEDTKGFYFKAGNQVKTNEFENLLDDLSMLPFPDRRLFYEQDPLLKNQEFKSFFSGRGCFYPCSYCFNHKFNEMFKGKGKIIRKKPVDYFIEEISETKQDFGCQFAIFEDDIFTLDKPWLEDFARKFKQKVGIPYICNLRPDLANEDNIKLLKESGCHIVRMAIETGNENIRNTILKRNMSNEIIVKASDLIHKYGLKLSVSNMTGLPGETVDCLNETIDLNIRCRPDHPSIQFFMPYPNMELSEIAIEKGYFTRELLRKIPKNTWKFTPLIFDSKTKRIMEKTQKIFPLIVKYPYLRKITKLLLCLPNQILYLISMATKIVIVVRYFPQAKVRITQRLGDLFRFFYFYGYK
jgi:anaerobic magnesium-protoporphyrin IX monomethyl ester cyclase